MDRGVVSNERRLQHKQLQACLNVVTHHSQPAWKQIHRQLCVKIQLGYRWQHAATMSQWHSLGPLLPKQQYNQPRIHSCAALNKETRNESYVVKPLCWKWALGFYHQAAPFLKSVLSGCEPRFADTLDALSSGAGQSRPCGWRWHDMTWFWNKSTGSIMKKLKFLWSDGFLLFPQQGLYLVWRGARCHSSSGGEVVCELLLSPFFTANSHSSHSSRRPLQAHLKLRWQANSQPNRPV